jgi:2-phosphoglycolate phosphatase
MTERKTRPRAIIFDLDGTLADTFPLIVAAWNAAVSPVTGHAYSDREVIDRFGIPDPAMIRRELGDDAGERADAVYHACYRDRHHDLVKPFPGVAEMLDQLHARRVPLGLMTGKGRRSADITLGCLGWSDTFAVVITGEDVPEQKPHPAGVLAAAARLGVAANECAFVGDSPADIGAAQNAKMISVAAGWHEVYHIEIRAMKPDVWAERPGDVVRLLLPESRTL